MQINARHENSQASKNIWAVHIGLDGCGGREHKFSRVGKGSGSGRSQRRVHMIKHIVLNSQRISYSKACCVPSHQAWDTEDRRMRAAQMIKGLEKQVVK